MEDHNSKLLHRITCPYTSQQNGIAKRKHRHVVEIGLTLLALKFWPDAFSTSLCLIHRMPTKPLKFKCPIEVLLNAKPDYEH